jgi:hypothetical protein
MHKVALVLTRQFGLIICGVVCDRLAAQLKGAVAAIAKWDILGAVVLHCCGCHAYALGLHDSSDTIDVEGKV